MDEFEPWFIPARGASTTTMLAAITAGQPSGKGKILNPVVIDTAKALGWRLERLYVDRDGPGCGFHAVPLKSATCGNVELMEALCALDCELLVWPAKER